MGIMEAWNVEKDGSPPQQQGDL